MTFARRMIVSALTFTFALVVGATAAFAIDLHAARSSGLVGEKADGYIAAIQSSPEIDALVADVNRRRKEEYARIAAQNGQSVDVVARLAAAQIIAKLGAGEYYQDASGAWKKR